MRGNIRFPLRFFLITFIWSWIVWAPLVLGSFKIFPIPDKHLAAWTMPIIILGAFGPLAGALLALHHDQREGSLVKYFRSFFDFHIGWKAYIIPLVILGGSTFIAWFLPELFGEKRLPMLLLSIWVFIPYLLIMIFLGGGQEEFGWRVMLFLYLKNNLGFGLRT